MEISYNGLNLICDYCHKASDLVCPCWTAAYCSHECQKLDWETHKAFCCPSEDKKLAADRRDYCLKILQDVSAIFNAIFLQRHLNEAGYIHVHEDFDPPSPYTPIIVHEKMFSLSFVVNPEKTMEILKNKTEKVFKNNAKNFPGQLPEKQKRNYEYGVVVLFSSIDGATMVFTLGSKMFSEMAEQVYKLPRPLMDEISKIYYKSALTQNKIGSIDSIVQHLS